MKTILTRGALIFFLGFVALFLLRLGYGYATQPNGEVIEQVEVQNSLGYNFELSRKNYAGQKSRAAGPAPQSVDQRYEKVARWDSRATRSKRTRPVYAPWPRR